MLRGPSVRAVVGVQYRVGEFRNRIERRPQRFAMRLMSRPRDDSHIDRTVALFLRDLDLPHGPILVVHTLQDRDRYADIGEVLGNIPVAEFWIEPGVVPPIEGVVDIPVPARKLSLQVRGLVGSPDLGNRGDGNILDDEMRRDQRKALDAVILDRKSVV